MMSLIRKRARTLHTLCHMDEASRLAMLPRARKELVMTLVEAAKMILNGKVEISRPQLKQLHRYEKLLRSLISKKSNLETKRQLIQTGGFVGFLLKPLMGLVKNMLFD